MILIAFNKPFNVLSQFRAYENTQSLAEFISNKSLRVAGRLDKDSEGLLLLTDNGALNHRITDPVHKLPKSYWVQVEGEPDMAALQALGQGVRLKDGMTKPARVSLITPPDVWPRDPPIRYRKQVTTSWLNITIEEGRNRQIRRMTSRVGHPTLRLIRYRIGPWYLNTLQPGQSELRDIPAQIREALKSISNKAT